MDLLSIIAWCTACLTIMAPLFMFLWARSCVKYSPYPYCFNLLSGALWITYGYRHELTLVIIVNGVSVFANIVYIALFFALATRADHRRRYLGCFMLSAAVVYAVIVSVYLAGSYDLYDGLCSTVSVLVSLAPFINLPMPLVPFFALLNGLAWTVRNTWAVPRQDVNLHLVIPSAVAALCGVVLSVLHIAIWAQGPPPPPTGLRRPLMRPNEEDDQGAERGDETRLDIDLLTDDNLTIVSNTQDANNRVLPQLPPVPPTPLPSPVDETLLAHGNIQIAKNVPPPPPPPTDNDNSSITIAQARAKNVPPPPPPPPTVNDNGCIAVAQVDGEQPETLPAKLVQEKDSAGQVVVDHRPAATSTKDKEEAEPAQPPGDGAAA